MRTHLKVPFAEKDDAKKLGARWDPARKLWYVENRDDLTPFARWSPTPAESSSNSPSAPQRGSAPARQESSGKVIVGSRFVALHPTCTCPPWESCPQCTFNG